MASTFFEHRKTPIQADWLNDVNYFTYVRSQETLSFKDPSFGAVADGSFVSGGAASGTDNLPAINVALAACAILGKDLHIPAGQYYFSAGFTLPNGVKIVGEGQQFVPFFLNGSFSKLGTTLLINGQTGADCIIFQEGGYNAGLAHLNVFNTNTNAIRSVIRVGGHIYFNLEHVSFNSLRPTTGAGLLLETADIAGVYYETLYGHISHVECTLYSRGNLDEASCHTSLKIISRSAGKRVNAVQFFGGSFSGSRYAFDISSLVPGTGPVNLAFHGTLFEGTYGTNMDHEFVPNSLRLLDYIQTNAYAVKIGKIDNADKPYFSGCYFELGSVPATYDNGVNGVAPLVGAVWLDNSTGVKSASFDGTSLNNAYFYDNGFRTAISSLSSGYRYDSTQATSVTVRKVATQSVVPYIWTKVVFPPSPFRGGDSHLVWDDVNDQAIIRSDGTYLIAANLTFDPGWTTAGSYAQCRIPVGGNQFNGSVGLASAGTAAPINTSITVPVDFVAGDVVSLEVIQTDSVSRTLSGSGPSCWFTITKIS